MKRVRAGEYEEISEDPYYHIRVYRATYMYGGNNAWHFEVDTKDHRISSQNYRSKKRAEIQCRLFLANSIEQKE